MSQTQDPRSATEVGQFLDDVDKSSDTCSPLMLADRSCCCSAPPAFKVIVTSKLPQPHTVDLLMCGHHYRQCVPALAKLGALVFASDGHLV